MAGAMRLLPLACLFSWCTSISCLGLGTSEPFHSGMRLQLFLYSLTPKHRTHKNGGRRCRKESHGPKGNLRPREGKVTVSSSQWSDNSSSQVTGVSPHLLHVGLASLPAGKMCALVCIFFTPGHPLGLGGTLFWKALTWYRQLMGQNLLILQLPSGAVHMHTVCSLSSSQTLVFTLGVQASDLGGALVNVGGRQ